MPWIVRMLLLAALTGAPDHAAVERDAQAISQEFMSPFCPGLLLENCPSPAAAQLRERIRGALAGGESRAAIEVALVERYGESLRAAPVANNWGLVAWVTPFATLAAGGALLAVWLRRHRADPQPQPPRTEGIGSPELEAALERELRDLG